MNDQTSSLEQATEPHTGQCPIWGSPQRHGFGQPVEIGKQNCQTVQCVIIFISRMMLLVKLMAYLDK